MVRNCLSTDQSREMQMTMCLKWLKKGETSVEIETMACGMVATATLGPVTDKGCSIALETLAMVSTMPSPIANMLLTSPWLPGLRGRFCPVTDAESGPGTSRDGVSCWQEKKIIDRFLTIDGISHFRAASMWSSSSSWDANMPTQQPRAYSCLIASTKIEAVIHLN
jgi:hypothetical protein